MNLRRAGKKIYFFLFASISWFSSFSLIAGEAEQIQCKRMYHRLTGVPPTATELAECETKVSESGLYEAAFAITDKPLFYGDLLYYTFAPWSNEDDNYLVDLNDMLATILGYARDGLDFREFLYGDTVYTCENAPNANPPVSNLPGYANDNNDHYAKCGSIEWRDQLKDFLIAKNQKELNPSLADSPSSVPAGVYTMRGFGSYVYEAGTNRAALRYSLAHFLCEPIEGFQDTSIANFSIRRDVTRKPGGSSQTFLSECQGCHAGMDAMADAWAYLDWNEEKKSISYHAGKVAPKYSNNAEEFPQGHITTDDSWIILWNRGQNAKAGWDFEQNTDKSGAGPKALGREFANTTQFPRCIAKKALQKVCLTNRDLHKDPDVLKLADFFVKSGYKLRNLFAETATLCASPKVDK